MGRTSTLELLELRLKDALQLIDIHGSMTGDEPGRRYDVDSLNRSAVILAVAAWEGFIEDLAFRNAASLARRLKKSDDLPEVVREHLLVWAHGKADFKSLNREAKDTIWSFAGNGWRKVYRDFAENKVSTLNTPNSENVKKLFRCTLAIDDITSHWGYRRWTPDVYVIRLDNLLKLRHRIAHGAVRNETVGKTKAREAVSLVRSLGARSVEAVSLNFKNFDLQGKKAKIKPA